jgi:L-rhamnose isomerase
MTDITDAQRLDFIEQIVRQSPTGVSFDWIPSVEDERSGYRFMRYHNIGEPRDSIRAVIDLAMAKEST